MKELYYPLFASVAGLFAYLTFRKSHSIRNLRGKLTVNGNGWPSRPLSGVTDITVHHTGGGPSETIEGIARYHASKRTSRGTLWKGIAYHFAIKGGKIYQTNDLTALSYHNGFNNSRAIGIAVLGNYDLRGPSDADLNALKWLIQTLKLNKELTALNRLVGHREYKNGTVCPGRFFPLDQLRQDVGMGGIDRAPITLYGSFVNPTSYDASEADN